MKKFSLKERDLAIDQFLNEEFDLLIIGGGINGAGIARDACLRGMKVALIEAGDFSQGTSSKSSKLIHGGIRYLENAEFGLVNEALSERSKLFCMAPHLVYPLRFLIPVYEDSRVTPFKLSLGMWLYDAFSFAGASELHESLDPNEIICEYPFLKSQGLKKGFRYSDAYMDDDRLVLETLRSAYQTGLLAAANYVKAIEFTKNQNGVVDKVKIKDELSQKEFTIKATHVVAAVGPWSDQLRALIDNKGDKIKPMLRPTKGVHITFERSRFPLSTAVVMGVQERIVFAIPRHDMVIVGTTDTDFLGEPSHVVATKEDINYLLDVVDQYFPEAKLTAEDIIASYAGLRPLIDDGALTEGKTSREHSIWTESSGVTFVAGGKYTTYRLIAQDVVDHVIEFFSVSQRASWQRSQSDRPLNSRVSSDLLQNRVALAEKLLSQSSLLSLKEAQWLIDRHGQEALFFVSQYGQRSYMAYEALYAIDNTMCLSLRDLYFRRIPLVLSRRCHGLDELTLLAEIWKSSFGLTDKQVELGIAELKKQLEIEFQWKNELT